MDTKTEIFQVCDPANNAFFILYQAIKIDNLNELKLLLKDKPFVTASLITTGLLTGYTALHIACMEGNHHLVKMLVKEFDVDVNVTANNGVQPIHLAVLLDLPEILEFLLEADANINAEINEKMVVQHGKNHRLWCPDFGNKMTLLTYSVLSCQDICICRLLAHKANNNIISYKNKTLMMYAIERNLETASALAIYHIDRKIINHRDNDGRHVIHYLLHPNNYENFRYAIFEPMNDLYSKGNVLRQLIRYGANIYTLINDDPNTLLLNMAAYRASASILEILLPYYDFIFQSKALYYASHPVEDDQIKWVPNEWRNNLLERKMECLKLIIKDLLNRRNFGLDVPDGEEKLLNDIIESDVTIAQIVYDYEQDFIEGVFKNQVIRYGDKTIVYYDFISLSVDRKKLQKIVKEGNFLNIIKRLDIRSENHNYFTYLLYRRIKKAVERNELLEKLKTVPQLRIAIPLPYELILDIIEFLDNYDMEVFIDAFFST